MPSIDLRMLPLATLSLALAGPALADTAEDEAQAPIIVTGLRDGYAIDQADATKTGTALRDTPQSIVTLGRAQMNDQAVEQLNDALRYVPGVTLGQGEGHRDQVVLRGQSTTADFFIDGLRDDAQYYRPLFNTERVEVLKGANALLFGRGGGGGIINRVTKQAKLGSTAGGFSAGLDSFGAWSVAGDGNVQLGQAAALRVNATYESFTSHRDDYSGHFIGVAPTIQIKLGDATDLTLGYEYNRDDRVVDRGVPSLNHLPISGYDRTFFGDPGANRGTVDAHAARARLEHRISDALILTVSGQFVDSDKYYLNLLPAGATSTSVTLSGYDSGARRQSWIGQANLVWKGQTGGIGHTLLAGIEGADQDTVSTRRNALFGTALTTIVPLAQRLTLPTYTWSARVTDATSRVGSFSAYLQDQIELAPFLQVIGGLRYDRFAIDVDDRVHARQTARRDAMWSPRLGLVLKPRETISLYASYAKSFLPQAGDQFSALDASLQNLDPEAFRNLEVGAKWDVMPVLAFTAAAFQVDRTNTRVADPLNPGFFVLSGASRVRGMELALAGKFAERWHGTIGYTYQQGEIRAATSAAPAGRQLDKLPRHQFSAWTRYDVTSRLGFGLGLVHQSAQWATISNQVRLPGFTRIDAAAYYDLSDRFALQLNVENLTDVRYFPSAHTDNNIATGKPLSARMTARVKL